MDILAAAAGILLLVAVATDLTATAIAPAHHGGWLTRRLGVRLWAAARDVLGRGRGLQVAGLVLVIGLVVTWILLLLAGWSLVLHGLADLVRSDGRPAGFGDAAYYAGYVVSTMGNGDLQPSTGIGQALTVVASISGLLTLTLSITYLIPVLSAAGDRHALAGRIHAIGRTPAELAEALWPGGATGGHDDLVRDLAQDILATTQAHSSYPVLHFFHGRHRTKAIAPNVAALDEALATVVTGDAGAAPVPERMLHRAIGSLLDALMASFVHYEVPATPDPTLAGAAEDEPLRAERRRHLAAWCHDDGWSWEDVGGVAGQEVVERS